MAGVAGTVQPMRNDRLRQPHRGIEAAQGRPVRQDGQNTRQGLDVAHVHVKVFPINSGQEYRRQPDLDSEPDHNALAKMAKILAF